MIVFNLSFPVISINQPDFSQPTQPQLHRFLTAQISSAQLSSVSPRLGSHGTPRLRGPGDRFVPGICDAAYCGDLPAVRAFVRRDAAAVHSINLISPAPQSPRSPQPPPLPRRSQPRTDGAAHGSVRRPRGGGGVPAVEEGLGGGQGEVRSGASAVELRRGTAAGNSGGSIHFTSHSDLMIDFIGCFVQDVQSKLQLNTTDCNLLILLHIDSPDKHN